ncbi:MAG: tRNA preQ1(34) S-adenosylmethionine ribosyltransferase-isomerase QueA [Alphaproteobacteria bacterium]|nr:tRNA preQ1(34) S-adenosylmethionine ribosyltransferase-isomerase QueA [Alphaproteobacteria bacterium]
MKVDDFDFELPPDRIATRPVTPRDAARLLLVGCSGEIAGRGQQSERAISPRSGASCEEQNVPQRTQIDDSTVRNLPDFLRAGDILVLNNTKVIPARLIGKRGEATIEVTLLKHIEGGLWNFFAKPAKKLRIGETFVVAEDLTALVEDKLESGEVALRFNAEGEALFAKLHQYGSMPLPPYMHRKGDKTDDSSYQTVFAKEEGAVAAPTAGLHFTPELLAALEAKGVKRVEVTLHVGAGTFLPVKVDDTKDHKMHSEMVIVTQAQADAINAAKAAGGRIVAVGTTALRTLESVTDESGIVRPFTGETDIFITPGYRFRAVDVLLTNFHLPRSTLFMLVSAFAGFAEMRAAYQYAIDNAYRFYSYGDASLLFKKDHP